MFNDSLICLDKKKLSDFLIFFSLPFDVFDLQTSIKILTAVQLCHYCVQHSV